MGDTQVVSNIDADRALRVLEAWAWAWASVPCRSGPTEEGCLAGEEDGRRLDGWIRTGFADAEADAIRSYLGGGPTYGTEESKIEIAVAMARLGHSMTRTDVNTAETNIELSYPRALNDWLTIQPDVQYVINPGWNAAHENALVLGARLIFEL